MPARIHTCIAQIIRLWICIHARPQRIQVGMDCNTRGATPRAILQPVCTLLFPRRALLWQTVRFHGNRATPSHAAAGAPLTGRRW